MFKMTAEMSWSTVLVLALLVVSVTWLVHELTKRAAERALARAEEAAAGADLASVHELHPVPEERHLTLVPDLPKRAEPELYDWETQGA